jgi:hypothetical protein
VSFVAGVYTVSLGGGALLAGGRSTATLTIPGATNGMHVLMTPQSDVGAGVLYGAWISSANTITAWVSAIVALTPATVTYNISVQG